MAEIVTPGRLTANPGLGHNYRGKIRGLVFETKGGHLKNPDTDYKEQVLETLQNTFNCGTMTVREGPAKGTFRLVFSEAEFPAALASLADADTTAG